MLSTGSDSTIDDNILAASLIFLRLYSMQEVLESSRDDLGLSSKEPVKPSLCFLSEWVSERLNILTGTGIFDTDYP